MTPGAGEIIEGFIDALLDDDAETLYDRAPCGYLSVTPDGIIIKVNATFVALTGYTREQLIGRKRFIELLTAGGKLYHETHYAPMLRMQGTAREIALELVCADSRRLPVLVNSVLERDELGEPVVIRAAVFDASHRRLYEQELLRQKQRAEASEARAAALARTLQQTLIPPVLPGIDGLEVAAAYRPAGDGSEVGGDFYDIFQTGHHEWVIVIGDVCGKGAEAAVVTALMRYTLRAVVMQDRSPAYALSTLNKAMRLFHTTRFCTAALLHLTDDNGSWTLTSCAAGHPPPLHIKTGGVVIPVGWSGTLLGVLDEVALSDSTLILAAGDAIVVYTDGVTEAREASGEFYGDTRLSQHMAHAAGSARDLVSSLLRDVLDFQNGVARDDIAIVALRVPPLNTEQTIE